MTNDLPIVLLHGSATGSTSWVPVRTGLEAFGARVVVPDMLGYGRSPPPSEAWQPKDEVAHLRGWLDMQGVGAFHFVTHSILAFFGLHLRLAVGSRVARFTLVYPVVVSVLRVPGEENALREVQTLSDQFMRAFPDHARLDCRADLGARRRANFGCSTGGEPSACEGVRRLHDRSPRGLTHDPIDPSRRGRRGNSSRHGGVVSRAEPSLNPK